MIAISRVLIRGIRGRYEVDRGGGDVARLERHGHRPRVSGSWHKLERQGADWHMAH